MDVETRKSEACQQILHAMTRRGIDSLMLTAYEHFQSPVMLSDVNARSLFMYPKQEIGDEVWDSMLRDGIYPPELAKRHFQYYNRTKYSMWEPFYADSEIYNGWNRLLGIVACDGKKTAVLAIFVGERGQREGDMEIFHMLLDALSVKLRKDVYGHTDWVPAEEACLQSLLSEKKATVAVRAACSNLTEKIKGDYALIVTPVGDNQTQRSFASYAASELMKNNRNIVCVLFEDSVVTLIGEVDKDRFTPRDNSFILRITSYLNQYGMVSGISEAFSDLGYVYMYYAQALNTAYLAYRRAGEVFGCYLEYYPRQIFYYVARHPASSVYLHPLLSVIESFDSENSTEYLHTLRAYCLNFFDRDSAAAEVCVHRNTLVYRLKKIEDSFGVELDDRELRLQLLVSFLIKDELDSM